MSTHLKQNADLKLYGESNTNIRFLGFNLTREPFTKLEVRQAIAKVVDRQPMIDSCVFGHGTAVATVFPPDFWAALDVQPEAPDIEGAKAFMATAGYADGFKTTMTSWSEYSFLSNAAIVMQEQLKQIGIEAEMVMLDAGTMLQTVYINKDFDLAVTGTSGYVDPHGVMIENFKTGSSGNFAGYSNPEVDDLITQGQVETDIEKRADIYRQSSKSFIQDLPWVDSLRAEPVRGAQEEYLRLRAHPDRFGDQTPADILRRRIATTRRASRATPGWRITYRYVPCRPGRRGDVGIARTVDMFQFIIRRILLLIPILFGVSVITFCWCAPCRAIRPRSRSASTPGSRPSSGRSYASPTGSTNRSRSST